MKICQINYNPNISRTSPVFRSNLKNRASLQKGWFHTPEGIEAIKTNVYALHSIKDRSVPAFSEATESDLSILNDKSYEAPSKRVKWFNPKDNKVYYLINEGKNKDGSFNIRILNDKGGFIKNASIQPKTIMIADNFGQEDIHAHKEGFKLTRTPFIAHGDLVERMAYVNNPFADYVRMDLYSQIPYEGPRDVDLINLSWSDNIPKSFYSKFKDRDVREYEDIASEILKENAYDENIEKIVADIRYGTELINTTKTFSDNKITTFVSSGNSYDDEFNFLLLGKDTQGVGSLNNRGKASNFTSSRMGSMTKHYELGEYKTVKTKDGINYTGAEHTDFVCNLDDYFRLRGKRANKHLISRKELNEMIHASQASPKKFKKILSSWVEEEKAISAKTACRLFGTFAPDSYENIYVSFGDWIPYTINEKNRFEELLLPVCGTSFSTPIRTARIALNESMKDII